MPTCQNCHKKWNWKQTFKRSFTLGGALICPYCKEKQYLTESMRKKSGMISFIVVTLMLLGNLFFDLSYVVSVIVLLGFIPLILIINPFFVELSNEDPFGNRP